MTSDIAPAHRAADATDAEATLDGIPADVTPAEILALWRDAERALEQVPAGSRERRALGRRVAALRAAYQAAYGHLHADHPGTHDRHGPARPWDVVTERAAGRETASLSFA